MTAVLVLSAVIILALLGMLAYAGHKIERLQARIEAEPEVDHKECAAEVENGIAFFVGQVYAALVLRRTAEAWNAVENQADIERLRREWKPGDPAIVSQWLDNRADLVDMGEVTI